MKVLEWSQHNHFLRCSRAANSIIGDGILTEFELIQAFIVVLIFKNEYNLFKNERTEWSQQLSHYKSMGIFKMLKGS